MLTEKLNHPQDYSVVLDIESEALPVLEDSVASKFLTPLYQLRFLI